MNFYQHRDHLGSLRVATDSAGWLSTATDLYAYGFEMGSAGPDSGFPVASRRKFTGHERDASGLDYMMARYGGADLNRFLSADRNSGRPGLSGSWNLYTYARSNPLNLFDPGGEDAYKANRIIGAAEPLPSSDFNSHTFFIFTQRLSDGSEVLQDTRSWNNRTLLSDGEWRAPDAVPEDVPAANLIFQMSGEEQRNYLVRLGGEDLEAEIKEVIDEDRRAHKNLLLGRNCKDEVNLACQKARERLKNEPPPVPWTPNHAPAVILCLASNANGLS